MELKIHRLLHELYARACGYFWLACPVCGRMFGGHESHTASIMSEDGIARAVCPDPMCIYEAGARNTIRFRELYQPPVDED